MKKLTTNQISGKTGVHLFSVRVLGAGLSFHETGALDTGIDGFIELRDPTTNEVRAQYIAAQLKTVSTLAEDTGELFTYRVEQRDLDYWLGSNAPVILVVVHLETELVFWKSIQGYFDEPERKRSRKIVFNRREDELTVASAPRFADLVASFARPGIVTPSMRSEEELETNLLKASYPYRLNVAPTALNVGEVRQTMKRIREYPPRDWIVHDGQIVTFRDLEDELFEDVCDQGAIDQIETAEWFRSYGEATKRLFVRLLNLCLTERMGDRMSFHRDKRYLYFRADRHRGIQRTIDYQSFSRQAKRKIVSGHGNARTGTGPSYYRHAAFFPHFMEIQDEWYLAIEPTYHFTRDGFSESAFSDKLLSTIKRFETNSNVRGHIGLWRAVLTEQGDMFRKEYPFLSFEGVPSLTHAYGVPDELWMTREDDEERSVRKENQRELEL